MTAHPTEDLRAELLRRLAQDEDVRSRLIEAGLGSSAEADDLAHEVDELDHENTDWLRSVVEHRGWPLSSVVGVDGAHAAWLLAQHADYDPAFQRRCLELMAAAVADGQASLSDYAYLTDRVLVGEGKPQRYGTQFTQSGDSWEPHRLEDPDRVDGRRAEVGLGTINEYAEQLRRAYGAPRGDPTS
jgi:hypothetical protein